MAGWGDVGSRAQSSSSELQRTRPAWQRRRTRSRSRVQTGGPPSAQRTASSKNPNKRSIPWVAEVARKMPGKSENTGWVPGAKLCGSGAKLSHDPRCQTLCDKAYSRLGLAPDGSCMCDRRRYNLYAHSARSAEKPRTACRALLS